MLVLIKQENIAKNINIIQNKILKIYQKKHVMNKYNIQVDNNLQDKNKDLILMKK